MSKEEFLFFRQKIFDLAGISLSEAKIDLLQSRLRSRVLQRGLSSYLEYKQYLESIGSGHEEWELFVNQLTTNKTDWFREDEHFTFLIEEFLPQWMKLKKKHLSVWCAASSTGEEPYTLAMVLQKYFQNSSVTFEIIATDIDTKVLKFASNGVYPRAGLELVPSEYQKFAFLMGTGEIEKWMKVKKEIKTHVKYVQLNLTEPLSFPKKFDLVFCRNVLIYFSPETILKVVNSIFDVSEDQAVLVIAHSESLKNVKSKWKYVRPSIYQKGDQF
jgi:chemotaxis protein methyltransferase CheR